MAIQISGVQLGTLSAGPVPIALDDLSDVVITAPVNGDFLRYNSGSAQWNNTSLGIVLGANGGTGIANTGKTITLGGNLTTVGAFATTLTATNTTNITLPVAGTLAITGANTFTAAQTISVAGSTTVGQLTIGGTTNHWIDLGNIGAAPPTVSTRSVGTKIVLYTGLGASSVDYAIGVESSTVWNSVSSTSGFFKWYGGTTLLSTLAGTGTLTTTGAITASSGVANNLTISGSAAASPTTITAAGTDPNIGVNIVTKGTGQLTVNGVLISNAGGLPITIVSSTTQTAASNNQYVLTNTGASTTLTLPASPANGDAVWVTNITGRTDSVLARNGNLIMGIAENMTIDILDINLQFRFINSTYGWRMM